MTATATPRTNQHFAHMSTGRLVEQRRYAYSGSITRQWAFGESTGAGVSVCIIDSGVDQTHPAVGPLERGAWTVDRRESAPGDTFTVVPDDEGDVAGHGTACAGIIRDLAPGVALGSVRILGARLGGDGNALVAALRWAIENGFDLVNLSLSTRRAAFKEELHDLVDQAHFGGALVVSSAHNSPVDSFPWRFASAVSVGSHDHPDRTRLEVNDTPPVEFFAAGVDIDVCWPGGGQSRVSGNSFATPHVTAMLALLRANHPYLGAAQLKQVLAATAANLCEEKS